MKLRYYMRGLGIGMLVAALVLVLSGNTGKRMTDEEIKKRAAELGMVENTKEVLADIEKEEAVESVVKAETGEQAETQITAETETKPETQKAEETETKPETQKTEETETKPETQKTEETETKPETQKAEEIETKQETPEEQKKNEIEALKKAAEEVAEKAQNLNPNGVAIILVQGGDSSVAVAKRAEAAGLVESAMDFDRFLCQNGYDKSICVGNYEVPIGATQEEIAKIITRRQ